MATLGQLVANSLWFAFDALDQPKLGSVPKSQLKVLTQNIGVILKLERNVENCIEDYLSVPSLSFEQYLFFLIYEVFSEVDDGKTSFYDVKEHYDELEKAFWVLGRPSVLSRHQPILDEESVFKMFRIFCLLADRTSEKGCLTHVTISRGEVEEVSRALIAELGREWDGQDFDQISLMIPTFTLPVFLAFLEGRYLQDVEAPAIEAATEELYQLFIEQIMEKGRLYQKIPWAPIWVLRDVEVVQWEIRPFKGVGVLEPIETKIRGSSVISKFTPQSSVRSIPDDSGAKPCRITLTTANNKSLHFAATDHRSKTRWIRAFEIAIQHSKELLPYQKLLSSARKEDRAIEEEREIEEKIRRASQADIIEQTQAELVAERLARAEAEAAAREEAAARANEEKRVQELTNLRQELEILLEQETQAKNDEEIVRNLQARVLREEWEKRDELEKLQEEQKILLEEEKRKRKAFEKVQYEKEAQLREAQEKLKKLETERQKLDHDLRTTREKIVMSERGKEILEARMKVKERTPPVRTYSLRPVRREQRNTPVRSSSFNTQMTNRTKIVRQENSQLPRQQEEHPSDDSLDDLSNASWNALAASNDSIDKHRGHLGSNHKKRGSKDCLELQKDFSEDSNLDSPEQESAAIDNLNISEEKT